MYMPHTSSLVSRAEEEVEEAALVGQVVVQMLHGWQVVQMPELVLHQYLQQACFGLL